MGTNNIDNKQTATNKTNNQINTKTNIDKTNKQTIKLPQTKKVFFYFYKLQK